METKDYLDELLTLVDEHQQDMQITDKLSEIYKAKNGNFHLSTDYKQMYQDAVKELEIARADQFPDEIKLPLPDPTFTCYKKIWRNGNDTKTLGYYNGIKCYEKYKRNGTLHRDDDKPASVYFDENGGGDLRCQVWFQNGIKHRNGGPAEIYYADNNVPLREMWYQNGEQHRDDGPAVSLYDVNGSISRTEWLKNGKLHREGGPAYIRYNEDGTIAYQGFFFDGKEKPIITLKAAQANPV